MVVVVPMLARLRVVVVQIQLIAVTVQVEHVRIAIAVCYIYDAILATARSIGVRLYFMWDHNPPAPYTKFILYFHNLALRCKKP